MSEDCLFCRIAKNKEPNYRVYEDDNVVAFLDIHPISDGHTLLIPKTHAVMVEDLPDEDYQALFNALKKLIKPIQNAMNATDSNITINNGRKAGQIIPHVHIHVIPRTSMIKDRLFSAIGRAKPRPKTYFEEIARKIREKISEETSEN
ncbi:MAG: HIT family protein [Candidatus Bathyarchaeota archaeon]|nr:HIT family protein [Candidatus Bathyarchaeota archaeon]